MKLKRTIGQKTLLMITINAILGTGIFFLPAIGAVYSGTSSILAWIAMSVVAVFISLYFAELISMYPKSGGAYEFVKHAFGKSPSFVFGWLSWIVSNITIAMLIVGSVLYLFPGAGIAFNVLLAVSFIIFFNFINYRGIDISSKMLFFFGSMTIVTIIALIVPGLFTANPANFSGLFSVPAPLMLITIYFIAETFFGWETTTYLAEEIKNARKVLPRMLVIATVSIAAISTLLVFVALGNVDAAVFSTQSAPLAFLASSFFGPEAGKIFALVIFVPLVGTAASWIISSPRLLFAMSRDKMLIPRFSRIHKKYKTPHNAILFQTAVTAAITLIAFGNYFFLLSLLIPLVIIMYSFVMLSIVKLRIDKPDAKRYFNAPFPRAGPILVILFNLSLLYVWLTHVSFAVQIFAMGIIMAVIGAPLYIVIRLQTDKKFVEKFYDRISFMWDTVFHVWYGDGEANKITKKLRLKKTSNVLDFGCGSGYTTLALARRASRGNVVAVDLSEKQLQHAINKVRNANISNVIFVKGDRKFPDNSFDAITAVGVLEHLDNPRKYVYDLMKSLKPGGRFYFLSFGSSFWIPAPEFLRNEESIRNMFRDADVKISTDRKRRRFTEYVHIYGTKS